ncbi:MAG: alpha/beta hydrolase [Magnetococcales bacterium]|nr:alpha/beta hydrolase [Magnetococcales bacterium]
MALFKSLLVLFSVGYLSIAAVLYLTQTTRVFQPVQFMDSDPDQWGMVFEDITFSSGEERLNGWWLPASKGDRPVVLFFHGNASNISGLKGHAQLFQSLDLNVFMFDYRGYGKSSGTPQEQGVYTDAMSAWRYLVHERGIAPERIVLYGHSLGAAIGLNLAVSGYTVAGVVLEGAFTSVTDLAQSYYPWLPVAYLVRIYFDNLTRIAALDVPLLVVHSHDDEVVPFSHGEKLYQSAPKTKYFQSVNGTHNDAVSTQVDTSQVWFKAYLVDIGLMDG